MRVQFKNRWNNIRDGFWFIPSAFILAGIMWGNLMILLDQLTQTWTPQYFSRIFPGNAEWAKSFLSTLAASIAASITLMVSLTIIVLTLASQQFGPRLLRNFLRDEKTKAVLGVFFATAMFGFVVRFRVAENFIPYLSISFAALLAVLDVFLLILFIHHISTSIHVSNVMARVSRDYSEAVERLFPPKLLKNPSATNAPLQPSDIPPNFENDSNPILSDESGYIQHIDYEYLLHLTKKKDILLQILFRPGDFIIKGTTLALLWPKEACNDPNIFKQVNDSIYLGKERTLTQDVEFAINQLVEIAVRALSPAVNDPFTATRCLNRLAQGLTELAQIQLPSPYLYDRKQKLRLIIKTINFPRMVNASFNLIRQNGISSTLVMITLLDSLGAVAPFVPSEEDRAALRLHAEMVERGCRQALPEPNDRDRVTAAFHAVMKRLEK